MVLHEDDHNRRKPDILWAIKKLNWYSEYALNKIVSRYN